MAEVLGQREVLLEVRELTKRFGDLAANQSVNLILRSGQIHAVLGENGAGKSTLMKMLYGVYEPDNGTILMKGEPVTLHPPAQARAKGVSMVFQDFRLVPALTVLENISLAVAESGFLLGKRKLYERIMKVANRYQIDVDPNIPVWQLDLGQRQRVEILKVLVMEKTKIVIFDEPTSVLTPHEVDAFLQMLDMLRRDGYGLLLITHKINEVMACANAVTVLREGKVVFQSEHKEHFSEELLVSKMIGERIIPEAAGKWSGFALKPANALKVTNWTVADERGRLILDGIDLELKKGQIVGVAGISGNGQRELSESLFGLRKSERGSLHIDGKEMTGRPTYEFLSQGVSYVTEDPVKESVIPGFSILEHMVLAGIPMAVKGPGIDWLKVRETMNQSEEVQILGVASPERRADRLSGGNLQRMVLSRAVICAPKVLLISYPSRGLDIGTTRNIHNMLLELRRKGTAILLISEDMNELFSLSDEMIVLGNRTIYGPYMPEQSDPYQIGRIMLKGESA